MLRLAFSPEGFYTFETMFEFFSVIVAFLVAFMSYRLYKFSEEKKYWIFGLGFAGIGVSFIFRILMNINVYYSVFEKIDLGPVTHTIRTFYPYPIFSLAGLIFYRFLFLLGWAGIYYVISKSYERDKILFFTYFSMVIAAASTGGYYLAFQMHFLFYATAALFIGMITYHSFKNYSKKKNTNTLFVTFSFATLLISQVMFALTIFEPEFLYIIAETIQLVGYLTLAVVYYKMVLK